MPLCGFAEEIVFPLPVFHEANALHRQWNLAIPHEPTPDVASVHVFRAQENDAGVDSDNVCVDPTRLRIEGVDEAVLAVDLRAVLFMHGP